MFERLKKKWKVSGLELALVLLTFAIGGSITGYAARKIMFFLPVEKGGLWILVYILLITIIWPFAVILISIPFGQFGFFKNYIRRVAGRFGVQSRESGVGSLPAGKAGSQLTATNKKGLSLPTPDSRLPTINSPLITHLALFASGTGSNAQKIIDRFRQHPFIKVSLIVCNKPGAGVLKIAEKENIPFLLIEKEKFYRGNAYINELKQNGINFIVLAGFLWKIPAALIKVFPERIINIHPALLPAYGGKGMYGHKVHEAVIAAKETESGITIHYVDEIYDHGQIIFQATCPVLSNDTPASLAQKILQMEHEHFPGVIEELLTK